MKLRQIASNQTEVVIGKYTVLFSYQTPVAAFCEGQGFIRTQKKWSTTTSRHINTWLRENNAIDVAREVDQSILDNVVQS